MQETKKTLRKRLLTLLSEQKEEDRIKKSRQISERLFAIPEFQQASTILFYASFGGEVETLDMMKQAKNLGKNIALPSIEHEHKRLIPSLVEDLDQGLEQGPFGIQQPKEDLRRSLEPKDIDAVIVPGLAFDKHNYRLGRGAGYYDRFLKKCSSQTPSVGLAFDFQILDCLPHQDHDVPVSRVIFNS